MERALGRSLAELGYLASLSPLPFRDAQLAAGCVGAARECGARVAAALDSELLAVSALEAEPEGNTATLQLLLFEPGGMVRSGSALLPRTPIEELELTVRSLSERVFGVEASAPATGTPAPPVGVRPSAARAPEVAMTQAVAGPQHSERERSPALRAVGFTALGMGAAGALGAVAVAVSARSESAAYARTGVETPQDADVALAHFEKAERRAQTARVLGGASAGVLAAGAFMLLWERFAPRRDRNLQSLAEGGVGRVQVATLPQLTGAMVSWGAEL